LQNEILLLVITAASLGFIHTILGPDHYLPFIVLAKARNWSTAKTVWITVLCGLGHVGSSVVLGSIGIIFSIGVNKLEMFESIRGDWAAWGFLIFGIGYLLWGLYRLYRNKPHRHIHPHGEIVHIHKHQHEHPDAAVVDMPHTHAHDQKKPANLTPWILFLVFVLGPCEPLIPLLMYPAAQESMSGMIAVTAVFGIVTVGTMVAVVLAANYGASFVKLGKLEKYTHVIAGATIALSGVLILLGL
jgi:nickel/cobalt exporter